MLSQLHSNYLVHSLARSINSICHSPSVTPESFLTGTHFSKFWWQFRLHDTSVSGLTTRKISLSNTLAVTYLPHAPPHQIITHPGSCSSQPRLGSNWTKEFSSSRATGHHISVGDLANDWHQTPSPSSGRAVHKSHWTKQHKILWDPSNPEVSQCCLTQLAYSATVVTGKDTTIMLGNHLSRHF